MQDCPQCGTTVKDSANYCTSCGYALAAGVSPEELDSATGVLCDDDYQTIVDLIQGDQTTPRERFRAGIHAQVKEAMRDFAVLYHWDGFDPRLSMSPDVDAEDIDSLSAKEEIELETVPCLLALLYDAVGRETLELLLRIGIANAEGDDTHPLDDVDVTIAVD